MITTIAIVLFIILCPCTSYIIVKRKNISWNGVMLLITEDDRYLPITYENKPYFSLQAIGEKTVIKGMFLPKANNIPIMAFVACDKQNKRLNDIKIYFNFETRAAGTYLLFNKYLDCKAMDGFELHISPSLNMDGDYGKTYISFRDIKAGQRPTKSLA